VGGGGGGKDRGYTTERVSLLVRFVCQANLHIIIDVESTGTGYPGGRGCVVCKGSWVVVVVVGKTEAPQPNRYIYLFGLWAK
jgi:hypothetical protein